MSIFLRADYFVRCFLQDQIKADKESGSKELDLLLSDALFSDDDVEVRMQNLLIKF